jgi:hypothetical protein
VVVDRFGCAIEVVSVQLLSDQAANRMIALSGGLVHMVAFTEHGSSSG